MARKMPLAFWTFLTGTFALTALPPVTSGLASKDAIIASLWSQGGDARLLWWAAMVGVLLTSLYSFRMLFLVFAGESRGAPAASHSAAGVHERAPGEGHAPESEKGISTSLPLAILALACLLAGLLDFPRFLGGKPFFGDFLAGALPASPEGASGLTELFLSLAPLITTLVGIPLAWLIARRGLAAEASAREEKAAGAGRPARAPGAGSRLAAFVRGGFGFDRLYDLLFVRPTLGLAGRGVDPINLASEGLRGLTLGVSRILRRSQDGRPRRYLAVLAVGAAILIVAVLL
jgi:NADH-quinone oxidoreductase subunit L